MVHIPHPKEEWHLTYVTSMLHFQPYLARCEVVDEKHTFSHLGYDFYYSRVETVTIMSYGNSLYSTVFTY